MGAADRRRAEQEAWDREAATRAEAEALASETGWSAVMERLLAAVGPLAGRRVLDCGCGAGGLTRAAEAAGASAVGFDVSEQMLRLARRRAGGNAARVALADFAALPFPAASFDAAVGMFVLHHVDLATAAGELARVLRPGGRAAFLETWQRNPLVRAARRLRGRFGVARHGTEDERPLEPGDLDELRAAGLAVSLDYPAFVLARLVDHNVLRGRSPRAGALLRGVDAALERVRPLRPWGYLVAVILERPAR